MGGLATEECCSCRTAESNSAEMVLEVDTFIDYMLLDILHVIEGSKSGILVIAYDENNVGLFSLSDGEKYESR